MHTPIQKNRAQLIFAFIISVSATTAAYADSTADKLLKSAQAKITNINTTQLQTLLQRKPQTYILDVRQPFEIELLGGSIDAPNTFRVNRGWLEFQVEDIVPNKSDEIVVYCGQNRRSPLAALTLQKMGYTNVKNYQDGFFAWKDKGLPVDVPDRALDSFLYSKPQKVAEGVYTAIGDAGPPSYANSGHNNNLSFIVTGEGVVVINAGDNYLLARSLHEEIKKITDEKVRYVILENGQGHAMLGMNYWQEQGARVIAHQDAEAEIEKYGRAVLERMQRNRRNKAAFTALSLPEVTFEDAEYLELGDFEIEILYLGPSHSPGDISVWLPKQKILIAGDVAFHERLLAVFEYTDVNAWIDTWAKLEALKPNILIPGHGGVTNVAQVRKYTHDYLVYMRDTMREIIEEGGGLNEAYEVDQSAFQHLNTFHELARTNAATIFRQLEFE